MKNQNPHKQTLTIMRTISKSVKNKIEDFMINDNIKEAILYAQRKGVTPQEFGKIAGKYYKD